MAVLDATLLWSQRERRDLGRLAASAAVARCKAARISHSAGRWKKLGVNARGDVDSDAAVSRTPRDHAVVRCIQHASLMPQWTPQIRPLIDTAKPATTPAS